MPRNIEIKARVADPDALEARAASLSGRGPDLIEQDDTFFHCPSGRLKLRDFGNGSGELIFYRRADASGPKTSFYRITPSDRPDELRETLGAALGKLGRVRKLRRLYMIGRTRVHLDRVEGLGDFMELEVVLGADEEEASGAHEAEQLIKQLGIQGEDLVEQAYVDLLATIDRLRSGDS